MASNSFISSQSGVEAIFSSKTIKDDIDKIAKEHFLETIDTEKRWSGTVPTFSYLKYL